MGRAAATDVRIITGRNVEITRYETGREAEDAYRFHHQQRQISATTVTEPERKSRLAHSLFRAAHIDEALLDRRSERHQQRAGFIGTALAQEAPRPTLHGIARVRISPHHKWHQ